MANNAELLRKRQPKGDAITFTDVTDGFPTVVQLEKLRETEKFLNDDHWQNTAGWIGWKPAIDKQSDINAFTRDWEILQRGFITKNVCKRIVSRLRGAVLGNEPDFSITPKLKGVEANSPEYKTLSKELEPMRDALGGWWVSEDILNTMKSFLSDYVAYGRTAIRIWIPPAHLNSNGQMTNKKTFAEILSVIKVEKTHYENIGKLKDVNFGTDIGIIQLEKDESDTGDVQTIYELHYLDGDNKTKLRHIRDDKNKPTDFDGSYDLGGNCLTHIEGNYNEALISDALKSQQKALNHAITMENYANANINFPETFFLNAAFKSESDGNGNTLPLLLSRGIGKFMKLVGIRNQNPDGSMTTVPTDVKWREMVKPEEFSKSAQSFTNAMYEEAGMGFVNLASNPYPSGKSRVESMTDFLYLLTDLKTRMDTVGIWLITTVIRLVNNFLYAQKLSEMQRANNNFVVNFNTNIVFKALDNEDKTLMLAEIEARVRSKRSYIINAKVSADPRAELREIEIESPEDELEDMSDTSDTEKPVDKPKPTS